VLRNAFAGLKIRKNALREYKNKVKITIVELQLSFNKQKITLQGLKIAGFCTQNNNTVKKINPAKTIRPGLSTAMAYIGDAIFRLQKKNQEFGMWSYNEPRMKPVLPA